MLMKKRKFMSMASRNGRLTSSGTAEVTRVAARRGGTVE